MSSISAADRGFAARRRAVRRRQRLRRVWRGRALFAIAFSTLCGLAMLSPAADILQRGSIDALFVARHWLDGPLFPPEESRVAVIVIDEETYRTPPFRDRPRVAWTPHLAKVIAGVDAAGPRVIGNDLIDPTTLDQPDLLPRFDQPLLRAFARAGRADRLVLGEVRLSGEMIMPPRAQRIAVGGDDNVRLLNFLVDADAVVRRHPRGFRNEGDGAERLSFAVELARRAGATPPPGNFLINFNTGGNELPVYSLADMLACVEGNHVDFLTRAFKDKVVLFGTALDIEDRHYAATWLTRARPDPARQARCALPGDPDRFATLFERRTTPGVFIHAAAINTLIRQAGLQEPSGIARTLIGGVAALGFALLFLALPPLLGTLAGAALLAAQLAGALLAFRGGIVLPGAAAIAIAALAFASAYAYRFVIEDRERRRVVHAFRHYLSPEIVERLAADPSALRVGGERRRVTVMFADVVGYTTLTERLSHDPEGLVAIMNRFLGEASVIIERQGGYVDKFIGDALMALWGAPLDDAEAERHAVLAAIDLRDAMSRIDVALGLDGGELPPLGIRIGINSGTAIVGNMGGASRLNYTVTGDVVNLASRIEGANKAYGSTILIGEATASVLGEDIVLRPLERVVVKGRSEPVRLYEVIDRAERVDAATRARLDAFAAAMDRYVARDFAAAAAAFDAIHPADPVAALLAERAARYAAEPPPDDWTGSLVLDSK